MPSKYELIQALPEKVSKAVSQVRNMSLDDAPDGVRKDLNNLMSCASLSVTKVTKAVTSLLEKPTVLAYLTGQPQPTRVDMDDKFKAMETRIAEQEKLIARLMEAAQIKEDLIKDPVFGLQSGTKPNATMQDK
nr:MAG: coat protein [brine shrimp noda-like virus 3]